MFCRIPPNIRDQKTKATEKIIYAASQQNHHAICFHVKNVLKIIMKKNALEAYSPRCSQKKEEEDKLSCSYLLYLCIYTYITYSGFFCIITHIKWHEKNINIPMEKNISCELFKFPFSVTYAI